MPTPKTRQVERIRAHEQAGGSHTHVADTRALPRLGGFDLIWAVNDAVNYLLDVDELQSALAGMRDNLAPGA